MSIQDIGRQQFFLHFEGSLAVVLGSYLVETWVEDLASQVPELISLDD